MKAYFRLLLRSVLRLLYRVAPDVFPRKSELIRQEKLRENLSREFHRSRGEVQTLARALLIRDLTIAENRRQHRMMANEIVAKNNEIIGLEALASVDPLTGLYNQRGGAAELQRMLSQLRRASYSYGHSHDPAILPKHQISVLVMDLNHFKQVNDRFGHARGDVILCAVARHLQSAFRSEDIVFRSSMAGDEFFAYLINSSREGAVRRAEKLAELMHADPAFMIEDIRVTISIGIAHGFFTSERGGLAIIADLCKFADQAMYTAKETDRSVSSIESVLDVVYSDTLRGDL